MRVEQPWERPKPEIGHKAIGYAPRGAWPWYPKLRQLRPRPGGSPQLRLDIVPIPSPRPRTPPIVSTRGPRVHSRRRATSASAVAFRASTTRMIMVVRIPTPFRRLPRRTGVRDLSWCRQWAVGYRERSLGEDWE